MFIYLLGVIAKKSLFGGWRDVSLVKSTYLGLIPRTQPSSSQSLLTPVSRDLMASSGFHRHLHISLFSFHTHIQIHTQIQVNFKMESVSENFSLSPVFLKLYCFRSYIYVCHLFCHTFIIILYIV